MLTGRFEEELHRWGPDALDRRSTEGRSPVSLDEAEAYCRELARTHYENFSLASRLLPRRLRQHFYNVYAFCRWADDLSDELDGPERSLELLDWWRTELTACFAGVVQHPVFVALRQTIGEFEIPRQPFKDLLSAFAHDQRVQEYETFQDLLDYCRCSANPVGQLVLYLCGRYSERNVAWSDSICTGLQLANFWQDVSRDLESGRIYLPKEDYERFGYRHDQLVARVTNDAFLQLMRFEVDRAREFLLRGLPLVAELPGRLQVDIELFARGGLKILDRIRGIEYRVWDVRPVVTRWDRAGLFLCCAGRALLRRLGFSREPLRLRLEKARQSKAAR